MIYVKKLAPMIINNGNICELHHIDLIKVSLVSNKNNK